MGRDEFMFCGFRVLAELFQIMLAAMCVRILADLCLKMFDELCF